MLLFGWKCINNALTLGANLLKKNFSIDGNCPFGCHDTEDDNHLFLSCPLARSVWFGSAFGLHSNVVVEGGFANWLATLFSNLTAFSITSDDYVKILTLCWAIYMHRNEVLFRGTTTSPETIINNWKSLITPYVWDNELLPKPCRSGQRSNDITPHNHTFSYGDLILEWIKDKGGGRNVIGIYKVLNYQVSLVFFYRESSRQPILDCVLRGLRQYLHQRGNDDDRGKTLYLQNTISSLSTKAKDRKGVGVIAQDILRLCHDRGIRLGDKVHGIDLSLLLLNHCANNGLFSYLS